VQGVANSIWPHLQWTFDVPSNYEHDRMPVLDLQVGIVNRRIVFEFYQKSVSTRHTIPARSAHSWSVKRSTLTQEGVRRLLHTAPSVPTERRRDIMEAWDAKMRVSGYNERFRRQVIVAAVGIYRDKLSKAETGEAPLYRGRLWQKERRDIEKDMKMSSWYKSKDKVPNVAPLIINPTQSGVLKKEIDKICSMFKETHNMGVKVMERGGRKATSDMKSDPLGDKICKRPDCRICTSEGTKGGCRGQGMGYAQTCLSCPNGKGNESESAVYYGETGRSNYERGTEHTRDLLNELEDSPLWKHCQLIHSGTHVQFSMETTGVFKSCEERQTNEGSRVKTSEVKHILNSKSQWHQPPIHRIVVDVGNYQETQGDGTDRETGRRGRGARPGARGRGGRRGRVNRGD
jgi:hypothetical protein